MNVFKAAYARESTTIDYDGPIFDYFIRRINRGMYNCKHRFTRPRTPLPQTAEDHARMDTVRQSAQAVSLQREYHPTDQQPGPPSLLAECYRCKCGFQLPDMR